MSKTSCNLSNFLASPSDYTSLDLRNKNITDADCIKIANAIKNNNTLTILYLNSNQIGDKGAAAIGQGIAANEKLSILNLSQNQIGDAAIASLKQAGSRIGNLYLVLQAPAGVSSSSSQEPNASIIEYKYEQESELMGGIDKPEE